jgi:GNAT superfamily N-acetyltransferase
MDFSAYSQSENDDHLSEFITLYNHYFPIVEEREDTHLWRSKILDNSASFSMDITFALIDDKVIGGVVTEYYPHSQFGLLTYILVDTKHRRKGIALKLVEQAIKCFDRMSNNQINSILLEIEDPSKIENIEDRVIAEQRINFYRKLNAERICFEYFQPPLHKGENGCDFLWLVTISDTTYLTPQSLYGFLREFYSTLYCDYGDPLVQRSLSVKNYPVLSLERL